jgi:hypothetical protein
MRHRFAGAMGRLRDHLAIFVAENLGLCEAGKTGNPDPGLVHIRIDELVSIDTAEEIHRIIRHRR